MDAKFINPVLNAMVNVLATMAQLEIKPGKAILKPDNLARGDVTGLITIEGTQARGSLAISFPSAVILDITRRMLQETKSEIDDEVKDLTGEITNMVLGGAKAVYDQEGYDFGLTRPGILSGEKHSVDHPYKGPVILLPFNTDVGEFFVEICFEK